jgi:cobalt/nickel transport system permease protein
MALEDLAAASSPVHRIHPLAKLITTVVYVVTVVSFPGGNLSGLMAFLIYPVILMSVSGLPFRPLFTRLLPALPFSLMGGIGNLFILRERAFVWGSLVITVGMISFASILLKTFLTVFALLFLSATIPFSRLLSQMRLLRVPELICFQFAMTYRYLSVLWGEAAAMVTAYKLRGGGKGVQIKDSGPFLGQLILRSFDRAGRVYQAMRCRGFRGSFPVPGESAPFRLGDGLYTVLLTGALLFLRYFNLSRFLGFLAAPLYRGIFR